MQANNRPDTIFGLLLNTFYALKALLWRRFNGYLLEIVDCPKCEHKAHDPGKCEILFMWDRPGGPQGNGGCHCGVDFELDLSFNGRVATVVQSSEKK